MKLRSIKMQLIASVLLVELAAALCITGLAFAYERHTHFRAFEVMLGGRADSLLGAVQDAGDEQDNVMLDGTEVNLPRRDIWAVWDDNHRILGHSPAWTAPEEEDQQTGSSRRFQEVVLAGRRYRTVRTTGMRVVDPGDKGGVPHRVTIVYGAPTKPIWEAIWGAVAFYGLTSLLVVLLTGLCMFWFLRRGLAPLDELAAQAAGVSVTSWHFAPSATTRETTELAPLASALETALQGLERSFTQQHRFVSDAAHELKTGVAVLKSSLQLLTIKPRTISEYHAGLDRCLFDCERMEEIVAKMLTLARVENSVKHPDEPVVYSTDLTRVIGKVVSQLSSFAEVNHVRIQITTPEALMLDVDTEDLELLVSNILMNALQHSKSDDAVEVTANSSGSWAELRIADQGSGIEQESLPHIFDRFYRSDPSRSRHTGGTGLGLAICKAITFKSNGTIEIKSKVGEGTTAIVRLPLKRSFASWSDAANVAVADATKAP
jgi:signal transduction histidine kinase